MPWFCVSSRKHTNKGKIGGVRSPISKDDTANSTTNDRPTLAVVLQNFEASVSDELSVQRGQVVEAVHTDSDWTYVRNMDRKSGYIPKKFYYNLDQWTSNTQWNSSSDGAGDDGPSTSSNTSLSFSTSRSNRVRPEPKTIHVDTLPHSASSQSSVEIHCVNQSEREVPQASVPSSEPRSCTPLSAQAVNISPATPRSAKFPNIPTSANVTDSAVVTPGSLNTSGNNISEHAQASRSMYARVDDVVVRTPGVVSNTTRSSMPSLAPCRPTTISIPATTPIRPFTDLPGSYSTTSGVTTATTTSTPGGLGTENYRNFSNSSSTPDSTPPLAQRNRATVYQAGPHTPQGGSHPHTHRRLRSRRHSSDAILGGYSGVVLTPDSIKEDEVVTSTTPCSVPERSRGACAISRELRLHPVSPRSRHGSISIGNHLNMRRPIRPAASYNGYSNGAHMHSPLQLEQQYQYHYQHKPYSPSAASASGSFNIGGGGNGATSRAPNVRRSLSMNGSSTSMQSHGANVNFLASGPATKRPPPIHRTRSYQEAVRTTIDGSVRGGQVVAGVKPTHRRSNSSPWNVHRAIVYDQSRSHGASGHSTELEVSDDNVFLPESNKPVGIYRCLKSYKPRFKGEIGLRENELIIVLDYGKGEWAWVITSTNAEGLVPKHLLLRYRCDLGVGGNGRRGNTTRNEVHCVDEMTQTDPLLPEAAGLISPPNPERQVSSASSASAGHSASGSSSTASSPNTTLTQRRTEGEDNSSDVDGDIDSPSLSDEVRRKPIAAAATTVSAGRQNDDQVKKEVASAAVQTEFEGLSTWFLMNSLERPPPRKSVREISTQTIAHASSGSNTRLHERTIGSAISANARTNRMKLKLRSTTASGQRAHSASNDSKPVHYHDRISGLGKVNFEAESRAQRSAAANGTSHTDAGAASNTPSKRESTVSKQENTVKMVLTAIRDYTPPANAKNCLSLSKGDVLHSQPHMHYPKGWMWVWHSSQKSFGYIPKNYVVSTYAVQRTTQHRTNTVEDAV